MNIDIMLEYMSNYGYKTINDDFDRNQITYIYEKLESDNPDRYKAKMYTQYLFVILKVNNIYKYYFYKMKNYLYPYNKDVEKKEYILEEYFECNKCYKIKNIKEWNIIYNLLSLKI